MQEYANLAINLFTDVMKIAIPIGVVWNIGTLIVSTFMSQAFGGSKWFVR